MTGPGPTLPAPSTDGSNASGPISPTRRNLGSVAAASGVAAIAGYVVMVLTARVLDVAANAEFLVFWSLLFFCFGLLGGLQNEATRAVRSAQIGSAAGVRLLPVAAGFGLGIALLVTATSPWWAPRWFPSSPVLVVVAVAVGVLMFAGHSAVAGTLAGRGAWGAFSLLVSAESVLRLLLVTLAVVAGWWSGGIQLAAGLAAAAWLVLALLSPATRVALMARADVPARVFVGHTSQAMLATAATAALVVGFPVLLRLTSTTEAYADAAPLLLAISFTRAPLMLVVNAFQGVAITTFVSERDRRGRLLLRLLAVVAAVGVAGALAAALVGPWLLATMLGQEYRMAPGTLALLTVASVLLAALTLTGAAALALSKHLLYAGGWVAALTASIVVLLLPADLTTRATLSLLVGPVIGCLVHGVGIRHDMGRVPV